MERGLIRTSDGYIHYRSDGKGQPLILLHCIPRSSTSFLDVIPLLAKRCRVYAWDAPGYGDSDRPSHPYTIPDFARALMEFMAGLGLEKTSLLGVHWPDGILERWLDLPWLQFREDARQSLVQCASRRSRM